MHVIHFDVVLAYKWSVVVIAITIAVVERHCQSVSQWAERAIYAKGVVQHTIKIKNE